MKQRIKKTDYIYFCGIGGIGMSGLARIMALDGYNISGSDINVSGITKDLKNLGIKIYSNQEAKNLKETDYFIYSAAIPKDNPEYLEAQKKGIKMVSRSELLGVLMDDKKGIAIAGTHGKTTTSTMLSMALEDAGLDPTMIIGGEVGNIGGNAKKGQGDYFVAEACEYEKSFLDLRPFGAIITNIEADHLDTYTDLSDITKAFEKFATQIDKDGFLVVCNDNKEAAQLSKFFSGKLITYGFSKADYVARNIKVEKQRTIFSVFRDSEHLNDFELTVPGIHNVSNALSVIALADYLGVDLRKIKRSLVKFVNAKRRYEIKKEEKGILVIDDYAHHPTEIRATLLGVAEFHPNRRVWAVFQPHQYSRTRLLFEDFSKSFVGVHKVIISDIYEARDSEEDKKAVTSKKLAQAINAWSGNAEYIGSFDEIAEYLRKNARKNDLVLTLGAGPVYMVGEIFLELIQD